MCDLRCRSRFLDLSSKPLIVPTPTGRSTTVTTPPDNTLTTKAVAEHLDIDGKTRCSFLCVMSGSAYTT